MAHQELLSDVQESLQTLVNEAIQSKDSHVTFNLPAARSDETGQLGPWRVDVFQDLEKTLRPSFHRYAEIVGSDMTLRARFKSFAVFLAAALSSLLFDHFTVPVDREYQCYGGEGFMPKDRAARRLIRWLLKERRKGD